MVQGNLFAENMLVGGQEILVQGDLTVPGLFWGDYNHGEVKAWGNVAVTVFMSTACSFDADRFNSGDRVQVGADGYESETWQAGWGEVEKYRKAVCYFTSLEPVIESANAAYLAE